MATTVLAHVAASMPQKENLATEALAFILNGFPAARGALQSQMAALVGEIAPVARVTTQMAVVRRRRSGATYTPPASGAVGHEESGSLNIRIGFGLR
jgi:hypothetical protein